MTSEHPIPALALLLAVLLGGATLSGCASLERGEPSGHSGRDAGRAGPDAAAPADAPSFAADVHPILLASCGDCHGPGGDERDALALGEDPDADYDAIVRLSDADDPEGSRLLRLASGNGHRRVIAAGSPDYLVIAAWMAGGEQP